MFSPQLPSPVEPLKLAQAERQTPKLFVKRDDLIDPVVSGNKWRKLYFNLLAAKAEGKETILTFGGAYSNHIAATARACRLSGQKSIGIIRGQELNIGSNDTLRKAANDGMDLRFISRSAYRDLKTAHSIGSLSLDLKDVFIIPEGGANKEGVKGCENIYDELEEQYDFICLPAGTGTTAAGILRKIRNEDLLVFPALKNGEFLREEILKWQKDPESKSTQLKLFTDNHFGGFAKKSRGLMDFVQNFKRQYALELDYLYTGKAFYGLMDLIGSGYFSPTAKILFIHSGGLQGNPGME